MKKLILVFGFFWGCGFVTYDKYETRRQIDAVEAACRARQSLEGPVGFMRCANEGTRRILVANNFPNMDLVDLWLAYRLAAAQRVDDGLLSVEEANLLILEVQARLVTEDDRRFAVRQQAEAQRLQAYGAFLQGLGVWQQSLQNLYPTPQTPITCTRFQNVIRCF